MNELIRLHQLTWDQVREVLEARLLKRVRWLPNEDAVGYGVMVSPEVADKMRAAINARPWDGRTLAIYPVGTSPRQGLVGHGDTVDLHGRCAWFCDLAQDMLSDGEAPNGLDVSEDGHGLWCRGRIGPVVDAKTGHGVPSEVGVQLAQPYLHGTYPRTTSAPSAGGSTCGSRSTPTATTPQSAPRCNSRPRTPGLSPRR